MPRRRKILIRTLIAELALAGVWLASLYHNPRYTSSPIGSRMFFVGIGSGALHASVTRLDPSYPSGLHYSPLPSPSTTWMPRLSSNIIPPGVHAALPVWIVMVSLAAYAARRIRRISRSTCAVCAYELTPTQPLCPECGTPVARTTNPTTTLSP